MECIIVWKEKNENVWKPRSVQNKNQYEIMEKKDERQQCHYKHLQTEGTQGLKELYQNNLYFRFKWHIMHYSIPTLFRFKCLQPIGTGKQFSTQTHSMLFSSASQSIELLLLLLRSLFDFEKCILFALSLPKVSLQTDLILWERKKNTQ